MKLKKRLFFPILAIALTVFIGSLRWPISQQVLPQAVAPTSLPSSFRVASWNIHGAADSSLEHISSLIKDFDLVALNEVHANFTPQSQTLGLLLNTHSLFAPSEWRWFHPHLGNALLHKPGRLQADISPLPSSPGRGKRSVLVTHFPGDPKPVYVMVAHIDRVTDRQNQIQIVSSRFAQLPTPSILMGDFNSSPTDAELKKIVEIPDVVDVIKARLGDKDPSDRIDYIFIRGLNCLDAGVTPTNASDHPLIWANLTIPE